MPQNRFRAMRPKAGHYHRGASRGFTLVELLLTISLMLLLMGAVVFSVASLQRGAQLDEGINQFEALLQFSRAEAANTGRRVQIQCFERALTGVAEAEIELRVVWERDPIGQPGLFDELFEASPYLRGIPDLVRVKTIHFSDDEFSFPSSETSSIPAPAANSSAASSSGSIPGEQLAPAFPSITFYPDGSSDSVEIVLVSQDPEDERRISLQLVGLTGSIHRKLLSREASSSEGEAARSIDDHAIQTSEELR